MIRFFTHFHQKVDKKGRTSVPSAYRELIEAGGNLKLWITADINCLDVWTEEGWNDYCDNLEKKDQFLQARDDIELAYTSLAQPVNWDSSGRILLPQIHRDLIGIDKDQDVVLVGKLGKFQIWDKNRFEAAFLHSRENLLPNRQELASRGQ
jgi:MraZ protein